jgi:hypothetical protein
MVAALLVLDRENACGKAMGESEDKLRQSVEFRCAGRIECLVGRRGLRVVGAEQRARLSEKCRDSAQHAGIERRMGRRGARAGDEIRRVTLPMDLETGLAYLRSRSPCVRRP